MRKIAYIFLILSIVAAAGCTNTAKEADKAFKQGDYAKAVELYSKVVQNKDLNASAMAQVHYNLAKSLDKLGRPEDAVEEYKRVIDLEPDKKQVYMDMAETLDRLGLPDQESVALQNFLILEPKNAHAESMLGECYAKLGQFVNARDMFEKAVQDDPRDPKNFEDLGLAYDKLGNTNERDIGLGKGA